MLDDVLHGALTADQERVAREAYEHGLPSIRRRSDHRGGSVPTTESDVLPPTPYLRSDLTDFYVGDCLEVLRALKAGSAGLVGGSPPFNLGKDYGPARDNRTYEEWLHWLGSVSRAVWHVLEEGGRYWLNIPFDINLQFGQDGRRLSGKQLVVADVAHLLIREHGWTNNALVIWDEGNISRRTAWGSYGRPTDPWVILPSEAVLVLSKGPRKRELRGRTWDLLPSEHKDWSLGVWSFPGESAKRIGHPAPYPLELPRRIIKLYSFCEDLVIDPWAGSGTTNLAASRLGRRSIYIDINPHYADLAHRRIVPDASKPVR